MTTFVDLHQTAAQFLEADFPGARITTAWPLSDALRRPEFGYVTRPFDVRELPDFQPSSVDTLRPGDVEVFVLYSREWEPRRNWLRIAWIERLWQTHFAYQRPISTMELRARLRAWPVARWERRGQWIEILTRKSPTSHYLQPTNPNLP